MKSKLLRWLLVSILLLAVCIPAYKWNRSNITRLRNAGKTQMAPIIMVPGSSATQNRFDSLIAELGQEAPDHHSVLKVVVKTDGKITTSGVVRHNDNQPFIVVSFENNKDGKENIDKQALWLNLAFKQLVSTYHFNHFSALGHSNGGLILSLFFERYLQQTPSVRVDKFMTIATPYNGTSTSTSYKTAIFKELYDYREGLPESLTMYSVAGTENYTSDGTVPYNSVNFAKYIFQGEIKSFTEITVTGANTAHSDLPQNKQIVSLIGQYILRENFPRGGGQNRTR
ncbi:alpha/beta hydrolase [Liquorilactobacillus satsumensis]|uniref:Cell surface hydrolase n=1 Tax=Liquorilactobacillus satsumensis DSM 16230 = JCM 12392 TaxID=1423801 RepID=A0A0R1UV48_9LACO|nr:alpha/beta hydrolase [Liquorilactobacillus satsumensis]KRL97081.1 cell surface hydrolase [Liquorilactobacillus satsumensis DSM 16230 = JCM 12392]MCC7666817.1 alpha/beta hydrolase [Liquorilactobacillus satsumensis]MCP9329650.1 alpha/beta hydrolase [Liquorilactobacillus satsumensis]MCP9358369.1 alpha/beta hydrolase [Liquorilactobacillus satsumensis]MCP9372326.1 alpha/beta hydrolase [Liquorilactobacillus satsumensis]